MDSHLVQVGRETLQNARQDRYDRRSWQAECRRMGWLAWEVEAPGKAERDAAGGER